MNSNRRSSRVIIIDNDKVLLMRRIKNGTEYYTIPGGGVEKGETEESAAIREIKEETDLEVTLDGVFCEIIDEQHNGMYYISRKFIGIPKVSGPEATRINTNNQYYLERINQKDIGKISLLPDEIKQKIIEYFTINQ